MKEEIIAGLKNALERGEDIEAAKRSFINAGYNPQEVEAAAEMISSGALTISESQFIRPESKKGSLPGKKLPKLGRNIPRPQPQQVQGVKAQNKEEGGGKWKTLLAVILAVVLLGGVAFLVYLIGKNTGWWGA